MNTPTPSPSLFIGGAAVQGAGEIFVSRNPADQAISWQGHAASQSQAREAVDSAHEAVVNWRNLSVKTRADFIRAFAEILRTEVESLAHLISREMGKPFWEARAEVNTCIAKVELTLQAENSRRETKTLAVGNATAEIAFRSLGVVVVLGPFNFPAHLPGGQIIPALLAGNTIVFKPSELTPGVGQWLVQAWQRAGLPAGVMNLVQGGVEVACAAIDHPAVSGVMFTGSHRAGVEIHRRLAGRTNVLLALEMGGNNPLLVLPPYDAPLLPGLTVASAFITSGQRCTCARRLIVIDGDESQSFLDTLVERIRSLRVGLADDSPEPFVGPLVSGSAADRVLQGEQQWIDAGGISLVRMQRSPRSPALLSPGLVDMTDAARSISDDEFFGPLLQVYRVPDFDAGVRRAGETRFGLAASLVGGTEEQFQQFRNALAVGVVNWNRPTTGASGALPFGGLGDSGNHRPAGFWAIDACSDPVASLYAEAIQDDGFDRSQL